MDGPARTLSVDPGVQAFGLNDVRGALSSPGVACAHLVSGPKRSFNHLTFKEIVQVSNRNTFAQAEEVESFDRLNMSGEKLPSLGELRKKIDACDRQLIKLLNDRMKVCQQIGQAKSRMLAAERKDTANGETKKKQVYRPVREKLVFDKVSRINGSTPGPLTEAAVKAIYREVMSCSINLQQPTTIGFLGPKASPSHHAAINRFGASMAYKPIEKTADILKLVEKGEISYGVIPLGNSHAGVEGDTLDVLASTPMKVYAEIEVPAAYHLLSYSKELNNIKRVYAHSPIIKQCATWLTVNLPKISCIPCHSNEDACERVVADGKESAAISIQLSADLTGIPILMENLQNKATVSRFFVISQVCEPPSGEDKTFIIFSLMDSQGALYTALRGLKDAGVNLTNIESRPSGSKAWDYNFFVRMDGHEQDKNISTAIDSLRKICSYVRVLGSYPANNYQ
ncbi:hypothetical protein AAMO2058_000814500 [Amorphochlora amoebiformis]